MRRTSKRPYQDAKVKDPGVLLRNRPHSGPLFHKPGHRTHLNIDATSMIRGMSSENPVELPVRWML